MERWLDSLFELIQKLIINFSLYTYIFMCCVVFAVVNCNKETYKYIWAIFKYIEEKEIGKYYVNY